MTIIKLEMEINKNYRFNPTTITYHVDMETAMSYYNHQMEENPNNWTGNYWTQSIEVNEKKY